jgi:hypothetical protein
MRARVFIGYWNFQLTRNERDGGNCDWTAVSSTLCSEASKAISTAGLGSLTLEETGVSGYEAGRENALKNWLHSFLDRQPGFRGYYSKASKPAKR